MSTISSITKSTIPTRAPVPIPIPIITQTPFFLTTIATSLIPQAFLTQLKPFIPAHALLPFLPTGLANNENEVVALLVLGIVLVGLFFVGFGGLFTFLLTFFLICFFIDFFFIIVLGTVIISNRTEKKKSILILGLPDSGKTVLFTKVSSLSLTSITETRSNKFQLVTLHHHPTNPHFNVPQHLNL